MSAQHTQGQLHIDVHGNIIGGGKLVAFPGGADGQPQQANARRLVACWNTCEGYETEELERIAQSPAGMRAYSVETVAALTAQRDELLALLIRYRNETPLGHQPHMVAHEVDAAIAKVKGGGA